MKSEHQMNTSNLILQVLADEKSLTHNELFDELKLRSSFVVGSSTLGNYLRDMIAQGQLARDRRGVSYVYSLPEKPARRKSDARRMNTPTVQELEDHLATLRQERKRMERLLHQAQRDVSDVKAAAEEQKKTELLSQIQQEKDTIQAIRSRHSETLDELQKLTKKA